MKHLKQLAAVNRQMEKALKENNKKRWIELLDYKVVLIGDFMRRIGELTIGHYAPNKKLLLNKFPFQNFGGK